MSAGLCRTGGQVEGLTITPPARWRQRREKAYEKGHHKASKQKFDEAQPVFEKAVKYPKYAVAWFELGNIEFWNNQPQQARHSFEAVDRGGFQVRPYRGLAELDTREKQWSPGDSD